jgi:molybdopterin synthase sulfur carrier subunit
VRQGRCHPDGWRAGGEAAPEGEIRGKTENSAHEKRQARELAVMQVVFNIPGPLREFTENRSSVPVELKEGPDLRAALQALFTVCPGLRDRVLTESGETRRHVNIFVANEDIRYTGGLAMPIRDGVEISIVPAISGGIA